MIVTSHCNRAAVSQGQAVGGEQHIADRARPRGGAQDLPTVDGNLCCHNINFTSIASGDDIGPGTSRGRARGNAPAL